MPDSSTVFHVGENSAEQVAFRLLEMIAKIEKKHLHPVEHLDEGWSIADRYYILGTFAQCCLATDGARSATYSERSAKVNAADAIFAKAKK